MPRAGLGQSAFAAAEGGAAEGTTSAAVVSQQRGGQRAGVDVAERSHGVASSLEASIEGRTSRLRNAAIRAKVALGVQPALLVATVVSATQAQSAGASRSTTAQTSPSLPPRHARLQA